MGGRGKTGRYASADPAAISYHPWNGRPLLRHLRSGDDTVCGSRNLESADKKGRFIRPPLPGVFIFLPDPPAPLHPQQFLCRRGTRRSYGPFSGSAVSGCTVLSSEIYPQISGGNGDWGRRADPVDRKGTDDRQYLLSVRSVCSSRLSLGAVAVSSAPSV